MCLFRLIAYNDFTQSYHLLFEIFLFSFTHTLMPSIDRVCSTFPYKTMNQFIINNIAFTSPISFSKVIPLYFFNLKVILLAIKNRKKMVVIFYMNFNSIEML